MANNNEILQQELENVSGGYDDQTKEIADFIRKHDPDYRIINDFDVNRWLMNRSGLKFRSIGANEDWFNTYTLADGTSLTHAQLMSKLNELFPE